MGSSVNFRAGSTKLSDVKANEQNFLLEFLDLYKTHMEKWLTALQCEVKSGYESAWALIMSRPCLTERSVFTMSLSSPVKDEMGHLCLGRGGLILLLVGI